MSAPPGKEAALRLLQGNPPKPEPYLTLRDLGRRLSFWRDYRCGDGRSPVTTWADASGIG